MLDQNTDRMWYVIGAVIVGAAIIFLINSSFPQLFASVGDTFKTSADTALETVSSVRGPVAYGPNEVVNGHVEKSRENTATSRFDEHGLLTEKSIDYSLNNVLKPNTPYLFTYDYNTSLNLNSMKVFFLGNEPETTGTYVDLTNGSWVSGSFTFTTNDPVHDDWYSGKHVRFDNQYSKDTNPSIMTIRNVRVREILE